MIIKHIGSKVLDLVPKYHTLEQTWPPSSVDLFPNEQNFDLDKSRQRFYHSLKEHHNISNIPKFRCKML
jgi:hypothetical protein